MRPGPGFVDARKIVEGKRTNVCGLMVLMYGKLVELGKATPQGREMLRNKLEFCNFLGVDLHRLVVP
jgi:hypothetical protein